MARAKGDHATMELPGIKKRPGRLVTGKAKTGAQRTRAYRRRLSEASSVSPELVTKTGVALLGHINEAFRTPGVEVFSIVPRLAGFQVRISVTVTEIPQVSPEIVKQDRETK